MKVRFPILLLACVTAGCSQLPPTRYYVLDAGSAARAEAPAEPGSWIVAVRPFQVLAPFDDDRIVYRVEGSPEIGFYQYHRWAVPVGDMMASAVVRALRSTDGVERVEIESPGRSYVARVEGRVLAIEEVDDPGAHRARIGLDLRVVSYHGVTLLDRVVEIDVDTAAEDVGGVVQGMNEALGEALADVRAELARALAPVASP